MTTCDNYNVIPTQAGIPASQSAVSDVPLELSPLHDHSPQQIPAFAGMTEGAGHA